MPKQMYVYIMTNPNNRTLYIGVTNDAVRRVYEHKNKLVDGFTSKYNLTKLVYVEMIEGEIEAIEREKFLKKSFRNYKESLISKMNPDWTDLYDSLL